jgi:hypothetical protein
MTTTFKSLALASLLGAISAPAFALTTTITCAEYKALTPEDQMAVASMAIAEIDSGMDGMASDGEPKAVEDSVGTTTAADATDSTSEAGSVISGEARAVEPTGGNTAESNMTAVPMDEAAMEAFMTICDQNLDATVSEAAAGLDGTK